MTGEHVVVDAPEPKKFQVLRARNTEWMACSDNRVNPRTEVVDADPGVLSHRRTKAAAQRAYRRESLRIWLVYTASHR